jgi:carbamoyltransferase
MAKLVLGIHYGYGAAAAVLVADRKVIAAQMEAPLAGKREYALFPSRAIRRVLQKAGARPEDVRYVALPNDASANALERTLAVALHPRLLFRGNLLHALPSARRELRRLGFRRFSLSSVEHHVAHLMSVRWIAGPDPVAMLSLDGEGDFVSTALGYGDCDRLRILERIPYPHSLGHFFQAVAHYLGFGRAGEASLVAELARHGKPRFLEPMRQLVRERDAGSFRLNLEAFPLLRHPLRSVIHFGECRERPFFRGSYWAQILGLAPRKPTEPLLQVHADLARSAQARFEEIANHLLAHLQERVAGDRLAVAGGCAANADWVGRIGRVTRYRHIYSAPAPGNVGTALGAALYVERYAVEQPTASWYRLGVEPDDVPALASPHAEKTFSSDEALQRAIAKSVAEGHVVAIARGPMDFAENPLGARVILADPRSRVGEERLFSKSAVPGPRLYKFVAAVQWEQQTKWFPSSTYSPFAEAAFEVSESLREKVPAFCVGQPSCRVLSVKKDVDPFLWGLLEHFRQQSQVPALWMVHFADDGLVPAHRAEAIQTFDKLGIDALVLGNAMLERRASGNRKTG